MSTNKDFFDFSKEIDDLDWKITEQMTQPTIVDKLMEKKKQKLIPLEWQKELNEYWYVYLFLAISALFTGTLAIYMGLSPSLVTEADGTYIHFNTDLGHVLLAIVYVIAFIGVTEAAFSIFKWKYHTREENNGTQAWTMFLGMFIAGVSILGTGVVGGSVVASNIAFLTEFREISPATQKWVVVAIPLLITLYTFLFSAYALSSESAKAERITREQERKQELDHQTRMQGIERIGQQKLQLTEIQRYMQMVEEGKISAADAQAAIRAGRTLKQEEKHQGHDIDGDQRIGDAPQPVGTSKNGKTNF
ncbi:MAG: hypothetical protein L0287_10105 [Anaerolineae bacterium]|nr:hypothetical protein [Anaerolineae bacterium]